MKDNIEFDIKSSIELAMKLIKKIFENNGRVFIHCSKVFKKL